MCGCVVAPAVTVELHCRASLRWLKDGPGLFAVRTGLLVAERSVPTSDGSMRASASRTSMSVSPSPSRQMRQRPKRALSRRSPSSATPATSSSASGATEGDERERLKLLAPPLTGGAPPETGLPGWCCCETSSTKPGGAAGTTRGAAAVAHRGPDAEMEELPNAATSPPEATAAVVRWTAAACGAEVLREGPLGTRWAGGCWEENARTRSLTEGDSGADSRARSERRCGGAAPSCGCCSESAAAGTGDGDEERPRR